MTANKALFTKIIILLLLTVLVIANLRLIVDNILRAHSIDEEIVTEANPRLDRNKVAEAIATLEIIKKNELTTIFPSVTVENEASDSASQTEISVDIKNASGINRAAASLEEKLKNKGYKIINISTAPSLTSETSILYKPGRIGEAQEIEVLLAGENWTASLSEKPDTAEETDITIILGK